MSFGPIGKAVKKVVQEIEGTQGKTPAQVAGQTEDKVEAKVDQKVGWLGNGTDPTPGGKLKDTFVNLAGAALGGVEVLAGDIGIQHVYGVTAYDAKVSSQLTRGSRIDSAEGYQSLVKQGYTSIVDLRAEGQGDDGFGAGDAGLHCHPIPIVDNTPPTEAQMKEFCDFVTNKDNQPVYVHCEAGKGRTGTAVACYRMAVMGWSPKAALAEAVTMGDGVPDQQAFILQFGKDLAAGKIDGYPLNPPLAS